METMVAASLTAMAAGVVYVLLQTGLNLFSRSYTINRSNDLARHTLDRFTRDLHTSIEPPTLIDANGAAVSLSAVSTNAAGVRFRRYISGPFRIPNNVLATATTVGLTLQATDPMPRIGYSLVIPASTLNVLPQDVYARITNVNPPDPQATTPTVTLAGPIGSFMSPAAASGTVVPADSIGYIVQEVAYVVTTPPAPAPQVPELRLYARAMSVATDGSTAFHTKDNYAVFTPNMTVTPTPFTMALGDRALAVSFTAQDTRFANRITSSFTKSLTIGPTGQPQKIPYKSLGL